MNQNPQHYDNKGTFTFPVDESDFRKSSDSIINSQPGCVMVAIKSEGVALRDSKDPTSTTLYFTHEEWRFFLNGIGKGEF